MNLRLFNTIIHSNYINQSFIEGYQFSIVKVIANEHDDKYVAAGGLPC